MHPSQPSQPLQSINLIHPPRSSIMHAVRPRICTPSTECSHPFDQFVSSIPAPHSLPHTHQSSTFISQSSNMFITPSHRSIPPSPHLTSEQTELRRPFEQVPPISSISRPLSKQAFCPTELVQPLQSFIFFTLYVVKNINHSVSWTVPLHLVKSHHCNWFPQLICGNCVDTRRQFV